MLFEFPNQTLELSITLTSNSSALLHTKLSLNNPQNLSLWYPAFF